MKNLMQLAGENAKIILTEMIDNLVLNLISKGLYTKCIGFNIGFSKDIIKPQTIRITLKDYTNSFTKIKDKLLLEYDYRINKNYPVRKIGICFFNLTDKRVEQLDIFGTIEKENKEYRIESTLNEIKKKHGKNSILRAISYTEKGTQKYRNKLVGGHNEQ